MRRFGQIAFVYIFLFLFALTTFALDTDSVYVIGADDVIEITVIGRGDYKLNEELAVSPTGKILLSIMQEEFSVGGKTVQQITTELQELLAKDYLNDPKVILEIKEYNSQRVLLIGEVKSPGEMTLESSAMSLKDLLIQAGGPLGNMEKVVIVIGEKQEDASETITISLDELLLSGKHDDKSVKSGDIIYVLGRDKQLPIPDMEKAVYVFGEVTKPGIIPFSHGMTALRAVLTAGNFKKGASPGRTTVKRQDKGKIQTLNVNLDRVMSAGEKERDIELQPGDVVYVPRAIF